MECTVSGKRVRFLTWSTGAQAIRARAAHALTDKEIAAADMGGDDLIAIDPAGLAETAGGAGGMASATALPEAAAWLTRNGIGWVLGDTRAAGYLRRPPPPPQRAPRPPSTATALGSGRWVSRPAAVVAASGLVLAAASPV